MGPLVEGTELAGCRVEKAIGRGGMGVVYRARQLDLDRDVAVKLIAPDRIEDPRTRARFLSEVRAAAAVEHPNVLPVYTAGVAEGRAYLVMRYVQGDDLRSLVRLAGPLPVARAAEIAVALGEALDAIHRAGFVHRDVKPANVLIDESGHVYLSDFGLAKHVLVTAGLTESDRWVGTLDFAAPEQIRGDRIDARADVYALGGVLHFMLTGAVPFERESQEAKLWAHLTADPTPPSTLRPELPAGLDDVVLRALAKDPDARYPSAGDLGRAARAATGGGDAGPERTVARGAAASGAGARAPALLEGSRTLPSPRAVPGGKRRRRGLLAASVPAALAVAATTVVIATRGGGAGESERPSPSPTPRPAVAASHSPEVGRTIRPVGFRPRGIAVLDGELWVISATRHRIARFDAATLRRHGSQPRIERGAVSIAAHGGSVWVAVRRLGEVIELDAASGREVRRIPVPLGPMLVAANARGLFVAGHATGGLGDALFRFDHDGVPLDHTEVRDEITALTTGGGRIWAALDGGDPRLLGFDARLRVRARQWLTGEAGWLAYGARHVWAGIPADDALARYDPRDGLVQTYPAGRRPAGVAVADGRVFVASNIDSRVVVIEPRTGRNVGEPLAVPRNPFAVAAGAGHVWVSGIGANTLTRIDY